MLLIHQPVLVDGVIKVLKPEKNDSYLDLTAGYGGHANIILARTKNYRESVLVDRDKTSTDYLHNIFADKPLMIINQDYYQASTDLMKQNKKFDIILVDLGVSSQHLNDQSRGFSFKDNGPLDMRMDQSQKLSAMVVVNDYPEKELARIISEYGDEPKARYIAKLIVNNRPILNTQELAKLCLKAWPGRSKIHPATRTFQAIRIEVNQELTLLQKSLPIWFNLLKPDGRLAVISFHSLEDRITKQFFKDNSGERYDSELTLLTKKPIVPDQNEIVINPRSRSAKLRAVVKNKKTK